MTTETLSPRLQTLQRESALLLQKAVADYGDQGVLLLHQSGHRSHGIDGSDLHLCTGDQHFHAGYRPPAPETPSCWTRRAPPQATH
jgi:hypothetical protein